MNSYKMFVSTIYVLSIAVPIFAVTDHGYHGHGHGGHGGYHAHPEVVVHEKKHVPIVKQDFEAHHDGYQYSYETGNGIHAHEKGFFKAKGDKKGETLVQQGQITYHDEHGHPITLTYVADEHGFQAHGDHLPTPPPVPAEIAKALKETPHVPYVEPEEHHHGGYHAQAGGHGSHGGHGHGHLHVNTHQYDY